MNEKQNNQLKNAKEYMKKGLILDAEYDKPHDVVEVCIAKWEYGSEWISFKEFEKNRQEQIAFNLSLSSKERGRLYKIVTMLKNEFNKLNTTWLTEISNEKLLEIDRIAKKYKYSLNMMIDILDRDYSYDDYKFHYFLPRTFDFMKKLWEMKLKNNKNK